MAETAQTTAPLTKVDRLYFFAQKIAESTPEFFLPKGAGKGDAASLAFMNALRSLARQNFGKDYSEAKLCGDNQLAVDFYFPDEETAVEVALGLHQPNSEYEHDIFKCLMAQAAGCKIKKLLFITKPGASKRQNSPGQAAIARFVQGQFDLEIVIEELVDSALA